MMLDFVAWTSAIALSALGAGILQSLVLNRRSEPRPAVSFPSLVPKWARSNLFGGGTRSTSDGPSDGMA